MFDVLNPHVIHAIRSLEMHALSTLPPTTREVVRALVENGLRDGVNPNALASAVGAEVGLTAQQAIAVDNFRHALTDGQIGKARRYRLRDRRFKITAGMSDAKIDTMVERYRQRSIATNASTIARTVMLFALKSGQLLSWVDAIDKGVVNGDRLWKHWSGVLDDRERDEHLHLEGETVRWDQPYSNGERIPGESTFNCRCLSTYRVAYDDGVPPLDAHHKARQARAADALAGFLSRASVNAEDGGITVNIRDAAGLPMVYGPEKTPVSVTVAGSYSRRFREAEQEVTAEAVRALQSQRGEVGDSIDKRRIALAARCVLAWDGFFVGEAAGTVFPLSVANAEAMLGEARWIFEQVWEAMNNHARFHDGRT